MSNDRPRVSIGVPIYNSERFLRESLDSLLAQTFADFEVIIFDNASSDGTEEICRAYTAMDSRIHYHRSAENVGAARNFNRVVELARGEYFKWAADDDRCAPSFLQRCVEILDRDPTVVLCYPKTGIIDEAGKFVEDYEVALNTDSARPHERFRDLVCIDHWCTQVFGLMRTDILKLTPMIGSYVESDRTLLAELGLLGRFHQVPETLFFRREHPNRSMRAFPDPSERLAWFDPAQADKISLPTWRVLFEYLASVRRVPLDLFERLKCYGHIGRWLVSRNRGDRLTLRLLAGDLKVAAKQLRHRYGGIS
jgi:glycosyltransferase involved in cell wall biosynthesis